MRPFNRLKCLMGPLVKNGFRIRSVSSCPYSGFAIEDIAYAA